MSQRASTSDGLPTGVERSTATGWVAWVLLGAVLLILLGTVHVGIGLVALFRPELLATSRAGLLLPVSLSVLAWGHVTVGAVAVATGVGLMRGTRWARIGAIALACAAAAVNFIFVAMCPVWSVTAATLAVIVVYAVAAHGSELADAYASS